MCNIDENKSSSEMLASIPNPVDFKPTTNNMHDPFDFDVFVTSQLKEKKVSTNLPKVPKSTSFHNENKPKYIFFKKKKLILILKFA